MPNMVTIFRARSVARSMSLLAPVVAVWKTTSSAARPPSRMRMSAEQFFLAVEELLLLRRLHGVAQGALGVGDDGDLAHRLRALLTGRR